jgi:hypothetical protein
MAAIFPPADKGGVPPGPNVINGYTPNNAVIGEGPLYVAPDCTTVLTADQVNAITSEILAAVDKLGFGYNTNRVDNLGEALSSVITALTNGKVARAGDTMTGPLTLPGDPTQPLQATTKQYVDAGDSTLRTYVDQRDQATLQTLSQQIIAGDQALDAKKVNRAGDTMTGPLVLPGDPTDPLQAATKAYVDAHGGGSGGGGIPDAPYDDKTYGRKNHAWVEALPIVGGTVTGSIVLPADPTAALEATTKQYVDAAAAAAVANSVRTDIFQGLTPAQQLQARQNIYAAPFDAMAFNNLIINAGFEIDTSYNGNWTAMGSVLYFCDNWIGLASAAGAAGQTAIYWDNGGPQGYRSRAAFACSQAKPALGANDYYILRQYIEGTRSAKLAWGTVSARPLFISFWVWSLLPGTYGGYVTNSATDRNFPFSWTVNAASTWEYKIVVIPGDIAGTWKTDEGIGISVNLTFAAGASIQQAPTGTWQTGAIKAGYPGQPNLFAQVNTNIAITGFSAFAGSQGPTQANAPLVMRPKADEMRLTQRYWYYLTNGMVFGGGTLRAGGTSGYGSIPLNADMRVQPTFAWSGGGLVVLSGDTSAGVNSASIVYKNLPWLNVSPNLGASAGAIGQGFVFFTPSGGSAWLDARL